MHILLVGAGGYAAGYVKALLSNTDPSVKWTGVVDPYYAGSKVKSLIDAAGIAVYDTMEEFYQSHTADLAIICTPTFLHREQSICALAHGSHVLCEKPAAPTTEQAQEMLGAEQRYGRFLAIGYQWSYSAAIQALKADILRGDLGAPVSFRTAISWPRDRAYYGRGTGWGGRISRDGVLILDSIASNACAHYLHNMLFLLGRDMETSTEVGDFEANCLRANDIESFDTCAIRMRSVEGVSMYFIASHAAGVRRDPEFVYEFERATVRFSQNEGSLIHAAFQDGTEKCYGDPFEDQLKKLWDCVGAVRDGTRPICTVRTAMPHTRLIERMYGECPIRDFPAERIRETENGGGVYVDGLFRQMYDAYERGLLLSELDGDRES